MGWMSQWRMNYIFSRIRNLQPSRLVLPIDKT
jgi:hypothetical protein